MPRPSLFRWLNRWLLGGVATLALFALALTAVNLVDYLPFRLALRRAERLTQPQLEAIAQACSREERKGHHEAGGDAVPPELRLLRPSGISFDPSDTDVYLHGRHHIGIWINVRTNPENQMVELISNTLHGQRRRTLWKRFPERWRQFNPMNRVVTLVEFEMLDQPREWILTPNELLVIDRSIRSGDPDRLVSHVMLTPAQRSSLATEIEGIGTNVRGHAFDSGALDGIQLRISFSPDGSETTTDVLLANTWRSEIAPLVNAINLITGSECAVKFPDIIRQMDALVTGPMPPAKVMTLRDYNRRQNYIPLPWWCLWPRLGFGDS